MKPKNQDKNDKMSEIDDKILKNFDIKKVGSFLINLYDLLLLVMKK